MSVYSDKAKETLDLLREHDEWVGRYANYADEISRNISLLKEKKAAFHKWSPLRVYLTTSEMKKGGSVSFSLRYLGQEVGKVVVKASGEIVCRPAYESNGKNFGYDPDFQGEFPWDSEQACAFRRFFANHRSCQLSRIDCGKRNEEHRCESMLLSCFEAQNKKVEAFKHIRPVSLISGVRFPMPTPISASDKASVTYSGAAGGGIDIFTRTGTGKATHLNVMELKDENRKGEEPDVVIRQAIAYATFLLRLLRSKGGAKWYALLGFRSELPRVIKVYATCVMPKGYCEDKSFAGQTIYVDQTNDKVSDTATDNADIIELHYMYFDETDGIATDAETSLR